MKGQSSLPFKMVNHDLIDISGNSRCHIFAKILSGFEMNHYILIFIFFLFELFYNYVNVLCTILNVLILYVQPFNCLYV